MRIRSIPALVAGPLFFCGSALAAPVATGPMTDEQSIASAESAAPPAVSKAAAVVTFDATGKMKTIREGTNGFTCSPDVPETPGVDPVCMDAAGMQFTDAWLAHKDPPKGGIGLGYMLAGGSDPDNLDPYALQPPAGREWVTTGPHIMIMNAPELIADYPTSAQPDTSKPYVMYPGTPYAHIMMPMN